MKERGVTLLALILTIIIIFILAATLVYAGTRIINTARLQTLNTNMLLIQAQLKILAERDEFAGGDGAALKGKKAGTEEAAEYDEMIANLINIGVLPDNGTVSEKCYIWDREVLDEVGLAKVSTAGNSVYLVNYEEEEVISSTGYRGTDGITYYKLSDTRNLTVNE